MLDIVKLYSRDVQCSGESQSVLCRTSALCSWTRSVLDCLYLFLATEERLSQHIEPI